MAPPCRRASRGTAALVSFVKSPDVKTLKERRTYRALERFSCIAFLVHACVHVFRRMDACMSGVAWMRGGQLDGET
jgi:hypothetical protein